MTVADYPPAWPPRHGTPLALDQVHKLLIDNQVYVFDPSTWTLEDLSASWQPSAPPEPHPLATFGGAITLEREEAHPDDDGVKVSLVWRMGALPPRPVTVFVHVYNQRGELVAQRDAPLGGSDVAGRYAHRLNGRPAIVSLTGILSLCRLRFRSRVRGSPSGCTTPRRLSACRP